MFQSYEDTSKFGKDMMDNGLKSLATMQKSVQAIALEAGEYSKKSMETGAAAFEKLFAAKSAEKAIEIQSDFVKQSYEGFVAQSTKMGELFTQLAKDAYKPFEQAVAKAK
jgi:hypothetical protein